MFAKSKLLVALSLGAIPLAGQLGAQNLTPAFRDPSASFTAQQSEQGKASYAANCQACHGPDASGGRFGPGLKGDAFAAHWSDKPAADLFAFIRSNMPPGRAGSLTNAEYSALTAYILQQNGVAPGTRELALGPTAAGSSAASASEDPMKARTAMIRRFFKATEPNQDAIYQRETTRKTAIASAVRPVTDAMLQTPPDGDWLMWRRTYSSHGFSPLKLINSSNASRLRLSWSWTLGPSLNEITPLVHDGVIYVHSGASVQALDGATGDPLWKYSRDLPDNLLGGRAGHSKGMAIYGNSLYLPLVDGHVVALDVKTGALVWDHEVMTPTEVASGVMMVGAPIVAKGKVILGTNQSQSRPGSIFALDAKTGTQVWRFSTIAMPGETGGDSWNGVPAEQRFGGSQWTGGSYDPELNLVYFGIGNTYSAATLIRPGEPPSAKNAGLFTDTTVALDPDTGKLAWHFQHMQRDIWDVDWAFEQSLVDLPINGRMRKLVVTGGKMALFDAVDRTDGSYVFSRDAGLQNIVVAIDPKTGAKTYNPALIPVAGEQKLVCPGSTGMRNWMATSYNPESHVLYIPMFEVCSTYTWTKRPPSEVAAGFLDIGFQSRPMPNSDGNIGRIQAIDLQSGKTLWTHRQRTPVSSSMLATAGGIAFNATADRYFRAYDERSGKILWQTRLASTASSTPITYTAKGAQYVAVVTGGGGPQDVVWRGLAPEVDSPAGGIVLWTFRLPDRGDRGR
ncbi:PQQ-binding-like beta-propeller repeat protein [Sphingomonas oligophenolica]|uniref:PQQ-binding-like beta-propeller repeat protein n=1 Tax=Sphingomonas oligophenolica TaxID=301154 RepID=A0ABU9Y685_9SPHN